MFAARPEDASHHSDEEHAAYAGCVGVLRRAEIAREPVVEPVRFVPTQPVEIVANRVEGALHRPLVDGLMHLILADLGHPLMLQPFLQLAHVRVADGPWERRAAGALTVRRNRQFLSEDR